MDCVLDYDPKSGRTLTTSADQLIERIRNLDAQLEWILETHVHADHLTAAPYIQQKLGGKIAIGHLITAVQTTFCKLFNLGPDFACDGSQFDRLFADNEKFSLGKLQVQALHTPGHTPACMTYLVSDGTETSAFVGDTLFMPDYGTARCDFPGGDAHALYNSIQRMFELPGDTRMYMCHDYQPGGRAPQYVSTVDEEREKNVHIHNGVTLDQFVAMRRMRDRELANPVLLLPSVQVNMRAGHFPEPENNGIRYLKIPLNAI